MKKLSVVLAAGLLSTSQVFACGSAFSGFYLGGNLGWTKRTDKTEISSSDLDRSINESKKNDGFVYGLYTGYGQINRGFYWGLELDLERDNASKRESFTRSLKGVSAKITTKYERGMVFGLAPRLGMLLSPRDLAYIKLGVEYSRDKVKATTETASETNNSYKREEQFVFVPSIGWERNMGNNLMLRGQYGYNLGGKIKSGGDSVKYTSHVVKVGLGYKF